MVGDADPKKWNYTEHTKAKHELLEKYLGGWLAILGTRNRKLLVVDGFAGKGEYEGGQDGSPVIIYQKAGELIEAGRVDQVTCLFVEENKQNFQNLKSVLDKLPQNPSVTVVAPNAAEFERVVDQLFEQYPDKNIIPSFWLIDPFGFTGMGMETVKRVMSLPRSEVFINLMIRDIGRFLSHPDLNDTFDRLFGTLEWRGILESNLTGEAKEAALRDLYSEQLISLGCYVTNFRVCMDDRRQTLYYMVHATKHPLGRWLMKDVMRKQGPQGMFAYLGPEDAAMQIQQAMIPVATLDELQTFLCNKYAGRSLTYTGLINESAWDHNEFVRSDYHKALQALRAEGRISVQRRSSKTDRGLRDQDLITFPNT
jgi:three-Cys-motif partner protein